MYFAKQAQLIPDYVTSQSEWLRLDEHYTELMHSPGDDPRVIEESLEQWGRDFGALRTKKGDWEGLAHFSLFISITTLSLLLISFLKVSGNPRFRFGIRPVLLACGMILSWLALADSFQQEARWGYYPSSGDNLGIPLVGSMIFFTLWFLVVLAFDSARKRIRYFNRFNTGSLSHQILAIAGWFLFLASPSFGNGYVAGLALFVLVIRAVIFPIPQASEA